EEQLKIIDSMFDDSFKTINIDELLSLMVDIYQRHLTQADVDGIAAFYEGPVGQKYLTEQPAMIQESMQVSQQYALTKTQAASAMMQQKMREFIESISKEPETKSKPAPKATAPKKP